MDKKTMIPSGLGLSAVTEEMHSLDELRRRAAEIIKVFGSTSFQATSDHHGLKSFELVVNPTARDPARIFRAIKPGHAAHQAGGIPLNTERFNLTPEAHLKAHGLGFLHMGAQAHRIRFQVQRPIHP